MITKFRIFENIETDIKDQSFFDKLSTSEKELAICDMLNYQDIENVIYIRDFNLNLSPKFIKKILDFGFEFDDIETEFVFELCNYQEKDFVVLKENGNRNTIYTNIDDLKEKLINFILEDISIFDTEIFDKYESDINKLNNFKELVSYFNVYESQFDDVTIKLFYHEYTSWDKVYNNYLKKKKVNEFNL